MKEENEDTVSTGAVRVFVSAKGSHRWQWHKQQQQLQ